MLCPLLWLLWGRHILYVATKKLHEPKSGVRTSDSWVVVKCVYVYVYMYMTYTIIYNHTIYYVIIYIIYIYYHYYLFYIVSVIIYCILIRHSSKTSPWWFLVAPVASSRVPASAAAQGPTMWKGRQAAWARPRITWSFDQWLWYATICCGCCPPKWWIADERKKWVRFGLVVLKWGWGVRH